MMAEEYFKMVNTLDLVINKMKEQLDSKNHNALDPNRIDREDLLYGLFEIVPEKRSLSNNGYHKAKDKEAYNEKCVANLWEKVNLGYQSTVGRKHFEQLDMIVDGLCNGLVTFGRTKLFVPDSMIKNFVKNIDNFREGKLILIEIFNYWKREIVAKEYRREFEVYRLMEEAAKAPIKAPIKPYTARISSVYHDDNKSSSYFNMPEEENQNPYEYLDDDFDSPSNERESEYDEDDSRANWDYNENH